MALPALILAAAASVAAAPAQTSCEPLAGIGCVYDSPKASGPRPLIVYFRGWWGDYKGAVPAGERARSAAQALKRYRIDAAADGLGATALVTGSSDAAVTEETIAAVEKKLATTFTRVLYASHSGGYVGLGASLPAKRPVARFVMLDTFYFTDAPDQAGRKVADAVGAGATCAGFFTPHNKERVELRFAPYLTCPLQPFGPADHDRKVEECLTDYLSGDACAAAAGTK